MRYIGGAWCSGYTCVWVCMTFKASEGCAAGWKTPNCRVILLAYHKTGFLCFDLRCCCWVFEAEQLGPCHIMCSQSHLHAWALGVHVHVLSLSAQMCPISPLTKSAVCLICTLPTLKTTSEQYSVRQSINPTMHQLVKSAVTGKHKAHLGNATK